MPDVRVQWMIRTAIGAHRLRTHAKAGGRRSWSGGSGTERFIVMTMMVFAGEHVCQARLVEIVRLTAASPFPPEVPQNEGRDGDTGNTTNNWANGSGACDLEG